MRRLIQYWYLATPGFVALDLLLGLNVRAVFADQLVLRYAWYAVLFFCGLLMFVKPGLTALIGMIESGVSVGLLIIAVYLPIIGAAEAVESGAGLSPIQSQEGLTNVVLSGAVFMVSFYGNRAALLRQRDRA